MSLSRFASPITYLITLGTTLLAWVLLPAPSGAQNQCADQLRNGSFEQPPITATSSQPTKIPNWRLTQGSKFELQSTVFGTNATPFGAQYLELASNAPTAISQQVPTQVGAVYEIRFSYAARPRKVAADNRFEVLWNGQRLAQFSPNGTGQRVPQWVPVSFLVTGTGGPGTLSFTDTSSPRNNAGAFIDNVQLCLMKGLAHDSCCCGGNVVYAQTPYPHLTWAIKQNGHFSRMWWDGTGFEEQVDYTASAAPLVSGTLQRDPFGNGVVALNARGEIVVTVEQNDQWATELVLPQVLNRFGWARPCGLLATTNGKYKGIWAVTQDAVVRFFKEAGRWRFYAVSLRGNAQQFSMASLYDGHEGQLGGLLKNGQRWGIWHENNDPAQMRFDYNPSVGTELAVPAPTNCPQ